MFRTSGGRVNGGKIVGTTALNLVYLWSKNGLLANFLLKFVFGFRLVIYFSEEKKHLKILFNVEAGY